MLGYSLRLALSSLRHNGMLTGLICLAVAIGISGSMTVYTVYYVMSGDPIPWKSSHLFVPQIDNWGPQAPSQNGEPADQLTYQDAREFMERRAAPRQAAMYRTRVTLTPLDANEVPLALSVRATYRDFFPMFDVAFQYGAPWSEGDEQDRANVVVLNARLAERLFPGVSPVGRIMTLDDRDYRIVGVLKTWDPTLHFYDVSQSALSQTEDLFLPFTTAIDRSLRATGRSSCKRPRPASEGWQGFLQSDCTWIQFWVELPTLADVTHYRRFLQHYAQEQQRNGRFDWLASTYLRNLREWLVYKQVVPDDVRATVLLSVGFLAVCLINAVGLMLAKFSGRDHEFSIRRALGASRWHLFTQCLAEAAIMGVLGGILGLSLTLIAVQAERSILPVELARVTRVDLTLSLMTILLAVFATMCAGVYPAWRTSQSRAAQLLRAQ